MKTLFDELLAADVKTVKEALDFMATDESAKRRYTLIEGKIDGGN